MSEEPRASQRSPQRRILVGTAGWNILRQNAGAFKGEGSQLQRYAGQFSAAEINSSFYRSHKRATYERWAASVPPDFHFAVKLPKEITHKRKLVDIVEPLERFLEEAHGLGSRLGPVLVQLPPSLIFDESVAEHFFDTVRSRFLGEVACEPRHPSWFEEAVQPLWLKYRLARVAADPARVPAAALAGGWTGLAYYRLHGAPKIYYSPYSVQQIEALACTLRARTQSNSIWCIFDNTASGAALGNALEIQALL